MNVIMQINKIIQTIVGADLSRTSPIMNINKLSTIRYAESCSTYFVNVHDRPWVDGSLSDVFCETS